MVSAAQSFGSHSVRPSRVSQSKIQPQSSKAGCEMFCSLSDGHHEDASVHAEVTRSSTGSRNRLPRQVSSSHLQLEAPKHVLAISTYPSLRNFDIGQQSCRTSRPILPELRICLRLQQYRIALLTLKTRGGCQHHPQTHPPNS